MPSHIKEANISMHERLKSLTIPIESDDWRSYELTSKLEATEVEIIAEIRKTGRDCYTKRCTDREWTRNLKQAVGDLGREKYRYLPFPNRLESRWARGSQWLFDLVWVDALTTGAPEQ